MHELYSLSNGVRIVLEPIPFVRSVSFGIWVGNGSRNESPDTNGISHFIEHMLFKGTLRRNAKDIADEMDAVGGQINAYTSKEYTCYYTMTLDTHFDIALDVLSDMFFNSRFDSNDINKERNVISEEINMYEDSPEELVYDLLQGNIWNDNSLGYPILGTLETISKFNKNTFKTYYENNYHPQNTVISIAGNFESKEILKKIESLFGNWKTIIEFESLKSNPTFAPKLVKRRKDIEQVHICLGFPGTALGSPENYGTIILNTIFGGGMSSRLFQKIREENGLAYSVYSFANNYKDIGLFGIYAGMSVSQTEEVIKLILDEIENLKKDPISELQLQKTKEQIKSNIIIGLESTSSRMSSIGRSATLLDRIQTPDEIIKKIDNVSIEDINDLIDNIFSSQKFGISAVGKIEDIDLERIFDL